MDDIAPSTYGLVILLASLSILTTIVGVVLALRIGTNPRRIAAGIGFSAGIMVLIAGAELIPQSLITGSAWETITAVSAGALLVAAVHFVVPHTHLVEERGIRSRSVRAAYLVAFGLILHDFPEGFAMANSYIASPSLGVLTAVAIAVHNVPEEFAMAAPAVAVARRGLLYGSAIVSSLAEPAGAILGLVVVTAQPELNAWLLAFAAGAMIYVSFHELLPMAREHGHPGVFAIGAASAVPIYLLLVLLVG